MFARYRTRIARRSPDRFGYFPGLLDFALLYVNGIHHFEWV
jgi:hypothetical protein